MDYIQVSQSIIAYRCRHVHGRHELSPYLGLHTDPDSCVVI
jgi:hypothetical protein